MRPLVPTENGAVHHQLRVHLRCHAGIFLLSSLLPHIQPHRKVRSTPEPQSQPLLPQPFQPHRTSNRPSPAQVPPAAFHQHFRPYNPLSHTIDCHPHYVRVERELLPVQIWQRGADLCDLFGATLPY